MCRAVGRAGGGRYQAVGAVVGLVGAVIRPVGAGSVDQGPFGLAGGEPAAGEPAGAAVGFGVSEGAFDQPSPLPVGVAVVGVGESGLHAMAGSGGVCGGVGQRRGRVPDLVGLVAGRDQQQGAVKGPAGIPSKCGDFHYEEMTWQIHEGSMTRSLGPVL